MAADHIFFVSKNMNSGTESNASGNNNPVAQPVAEPAKAENAPTTTSAPAKGTSVDANQPPAPTFPAGAEVELTNISVVKPKSSVELG